MEKSNGKDVASAAQPITESSSRFEVLVAADWQGGVKFYINR